MDKLHVRKFGWKGVEHVFHAVRVVHGHRSLLADGQRGAEQAAMLQRGEGKLENGLEIVVGTDVLRGIAVVVPLAEEGQGGGDAHHLQAAAQDDARRSLLLLQLRLAQQGGEGGRVAFPLPLGEADQGATATGWSASRRAFRQAGGSG